MFGQVDPCRNFFMYEFTILEHACYSVITITKQYVCFIWVKWLIKALFLSFGRVPLIFDIKTSKIRSNDLDKGVVHLDAVKFMLRFFSSTKNAGKTETRKTLVLGDSFRSVDKIESVTLMDRLHCPMGIYDVCFCELDCSHLGCCYFDWTRYIFAPIFMPVCW